MDDLILQFHDQLRQRLASGEWFSAYVRGPYASGKTTVLAQAVRDAVDGGLDLEDIAAFAPSRLMFTRLADVIAEPWGEFEIPRLELFRREQRGVPFDALAGHTTLEGEAWDNFERFAANEWTKFCARTCEVPLDDEFLAKLKPQFIAALRVDHHARATGAKLPDNLYLHGVSTFVANLKREWNRIDRADMVHASFESSSHVKLLVLDEIGELDRALLERFFPNASVIASGVYGRESNEMTLVLSTRRRAPARWDFACEPEQAPPPGAFSSLFIICPPWRRGRWLQWMKHHAVPPPRDWRWRQQVDAWGAGEAIDLHAQAVLDRFGTLEDLPIVRMTTPSRLRGLESEIVYFDLCSASKDLADIATSRATKRLNVICS